MPNESRAIRILVFIAVLLQFFYLNRFSRDVDNVDKMVSHYIYDTFLFLSPLLASLVTVIYVIPLMTVVIVPLSIIFLTLQVTYNYSTLVIDH